MQYARELREYQKSEAYQITCAKVQDKKIKRGAYALRSYVKSAFSALFCIYNKQVKVLPIANFFSTEEVTSVIINANSSGSAGYKVSSKGCMKDIADLVWQIARDV